LDTQIFTLLKSQAIEVFSILLVMREFATGKGLQHDVERLNLCIAENKHILSLTNRQLSELAKTKNVHQLGLFDTINKINSL